MTSLRFRKLIDLNELPKDWTLVRLALDWSGRPLLLMAEGKPEHPELSNDMEAFTRWYRTPPKAHHMIYWTGNAQKALCFEQSQRLSTFHVQPFGDGWLLGDRRGGLATVHDAHGYIRGSFDLGDASEDLQTTPDGQIWVSYFDEGVFGSGIGSQGLVCFDKTGLPVFRYGEFAEKNGLPMICDCYAMNVAPEGDVWINYYTDFPMVHLRDHALVRVWPEFGVMGNGFAIREGTGFSVRNLQFVSRNLDSLEIEVIDALDENGSRLTPLSMAHIGMAARGSHMIINTGSAVFETIF
jgi:hypothetical protein